ncbi:MAG: 8-amino-7-oxononanoate synthase [Dissulfurispiraceae bacterium]
MFSEKLKALENNILLRQIKDRETTMMPNISFDGTEYINFTSNDYLGLACSASLRDAAAHAIAEFGFGGGASRLLAGGTQIHSTLEKAIAAFKDTETALVFGSGYIANTSALPSIAGEGDVIFSDELNHASLIDGCRMSRAQKAIYRHRDTDHLSMLMQTAKGDKKIVVTDSIFSMDGDIAPLVEITALCKDHGALLYIDDAHATGVLGNGRGALAHFGLRPEPWIIQMGTFSKALGSYGAFIAAEKEIIDWLVNTARGFIYSTALPSCVAAASLRALQLVQSDPMLISRLWQNRELLFNGLRSLGLNTLCSETPIIPIVVGDVKKTMDIAGELKKRRVYCPAIRPPTVKQPRLRVTVTAAHSEENIAELLDALEEVL